MPTWESRHAPTEAQPVHVSKMGSKGSFSDSAKSLVEQAGQGMSNFWWFGFHGRPAELVYWIYPPFFFGIMSVMLLSPISPDINNAEFNHSMCPNITAALRPQASHASGLEIAATKDSARGIVSFFGSLVAGYATDKLGRKPTLLAGMLGNTVPMIALALTCDAGIYIPLYALAGFSDVFTSVALTAFIADLVPAEERSIAFGRFFFVPTGSIFVAAPLGGVMAHKWKESDSSKIFDLCALLSVIPVVWTLLFVPESRRESSSQPAKNSQRSSAGIRDLFWSWRKYLSAWSLILITCCYHFPGEASSSLIFMYWAEAFPECAEECRSVVMTMFSVTVGVSTVLVLPVMVKLFGKIMTLRIALVCYAASIAIIAFAAEFWWMWVNLVVQLPAFLMLSIISDLITQSVPKDIVGQALGLVSAMRQLCGVTAAPLYAFLLTAWSSFPQSKLFPGLPWAVGLFFVFIALCLACMLREPDETSRNADDEWPEPVQQMDKDSTMPLLRGLADSDSETA